MPEFNGPEFNGPEIIGRILCFLELHDYVLTDATFGFGAPGGISKLQCRRCGKIKTKVT